MLNYFNDNGYLGEFDMSKKKKSSAKTDKLTEKSNLWKKGQSGNPQGRPAGSRNKASIAVENLFLDEQERLSRKS